MVTITRTSETTPRDLVIVETLQDAEDFLDRVAGGHWGTPGVTAKREPRSLTVIGTPVGEPPHVVSTYTITEEN